MKDFIRFNERYNILILDAPETLGQLQNLCEQLGYSALTASSTEEGLNIIKGKEPNLILLGFNHRDLDGFKLLDQLKGDPDMAHIPLIILVDIKDKDLRIKALEAGADDFLLKPVGLEEMRVRLKNNLKIMEYHNFIESVDHLMEVRVRERVHQIQESLSRLEDSHESIKSNYIETILRLTIVSEYKDEETGAHIHRTSHYAKTLAEQMGLEKRFAETIYYAAPMHDIGKVGVPDKILLKKGPLDQEEWKIMQRHTSMGAKILEGSDSEFIRMARDIAQSHHERWDGTGYPHQLKGKEIPLSARIMNIADQYDALRSKRPYKPSLPHEKAVEIITVGDGRTLPTHFDPVVLYAFKKMHPLFADIFKKIKDE